MTTPECDSALCTHCQLPLPRPWWGKAKAQTEALDEEPQYCCLGCRLAAAIVQERGETGVARGTLTRLGLAIFFTMNVMAFTMALWTADVYSTDVSSRLAASLEGLLRYLVLLFSLPVLWLLGRPLLESAIEGARRGRLSTDLLLATGVGAAFLYSAVSVWRGSGPIYFEVGCVVLVMVTLGRWLEATGKIRATDALERLAKLLPEQVRRIRDGLEEWIPIGEIQVRDRLRVLPGERFPADGRLVRNRALVDEQLLTGESRPVAKQPGDAVLGGTLNLDGDLTIEVTSTGAGGTLARLIALVRQAREAKGHYERVADRVSSWFFPIIAIVALASFSVHAWYGGVGRGLLVALSVILIACPCALGLATPLAVWTALVRAAQAQVLFRSGEALERLAGVKAIRFDKTGTLTTGQPRVCAILLDDPVEGDEVLRRAAALAASSTHILSQTIMSYVKLAGPAAVARCARVAAGLGVTAMVDDDSDERTALGNARLMEQEGLHIGGKLHEEIATACEQGRSLTLIGWTGRVRGGFVFDEQLRPWAGQAIAGCRDLGCDVAILTGDHAARGAAIADQFGTPVAAELLPEDKVEALEAARAQFGSVAMVGDGVNDAPALAASDVGIAMGCGTDLSRDSAQVCLLGDELRRIPWSVALARQAVSVIRGNLAWSFGYNGFGVACAALGWLSPALAAFLMVVSSALVIGNSLRLARVELPVLEARAELERRVFEMEGTAQEDERVSSFPTTRELVNS